MSQNALHGWLGLILAHLDQSYENSPEDIRLHRALTERTWLASLSLNKCPATAAVYVEIFKRLAKSQPSPEQVKIAEVACGSLSAKHNRMKRHVCASNFDSSTVCARHRAIKLFLYSINVFTAWLSQSGDCLIFLGRLLFVCRERHQTTTQLCFY